MDRTVYTRTGDAGWTSLADGTRLSKSDAVIEALGAIDEASSAIGHARSALRLDESLSFVDGVLAHTQRALCGCAALLASGTHDAIGQRPQVTADDTRELECAIDTITQELSPMETFVLPAGCEAATRLHLARAITRRAERRIADVSAIRPVEPAVLSYMNRLSDLLFVSARLANVAHAVEEAPWPSPSGAKYTGS